MLVAGQCVADQNGIRMGGVQLPIGSIGDGKRAQVDATVETKRRFDPQLDRFALGNDFAGLGHGCACGVLASYGE